MSDNTINSDLIRGHIDTIVLHSISKDDKHAQQISDFIERKSNKMYKINQATLYSSLKRLENLKFVSSYWYDSDAGRRKFFKITEKGSSFLNNNVASWSDSKVILDMLMDLPAKDEVVVEKIVEKVVYVPHNINQNCSINTNENTIPNKTADENCIAKNKPLETVKDSENTVKNCTETDSNEVDFRSILNSLIKETESTNVVKDAVPEKEPEPLSLIIHENTNSKLKFNETINVTDYNAKKTSNDGKIDFGDLAILAKKDGFKLRISSKDSAKAHGVTNVSKLRFISSILLFLVSFIQFVLLKTFTPLAFNNTNSIIIFVGCVSFPIFSFILLLINRKKLSNKIIKADSILTSFIIVFNLMLVLFATVFILDVELSIIYNLINYLIVPLLALINIVIYYFIRFCVSKSKKITKI